MSEGHPLDGEGWVGVTAEQGRAITIKAWTLMSAMGGKRTFGSGT